MMHHAPVARQFKVDATSVRAGDIDTSATRICLRASQVDFRSVPKRCVIRITASLIAARQHSLGINGAPRHSRGNRSMRTIAISLALLSLGSAHAFAQSPSDLKTARADIVSPE